MVPLTWNYLLILFFFFFLTLKMTIKLKVLSSRSERSTWYSFRTVDKKQQLLSMLGLYPAGISSQKTNEENTKFSVLYAANRARPVF